MAQRGGKRPGAGRPKGSTDKTLEAVREIKLSIARSKQDHIEEARQYASMALKALAEVAAFGEGESMRIQAARELLDRGYGRVPEPAAEPPPQIMEGIVRPRLWPAWRGKRGATLVANRASSRTAVRAYRRASSLISSVALLGVPLRRPPVLRPFIYFPLL